MGSIWPSIRRGWIRFRAVPRLRVLVSTGSIAITIAVLFPPWIVPTKYGLAGAGRSFLLAPPGVPGYRSLVARVHAEHLATEVLSIAVVTSGLWFAFKPSR